MKRYSVFAAMSMMALAVAAHAATGCQLVRIAEWPVRTAHQRAVLDGYINGKQVGILVDTGAWGSLIQRAAATRLGLEQSSARGITISGVGGESQAYVAHVDELRIGDATRKNWRVLVAGEHDMGGDIALILGDDFFEQVDLEFDIPHGMLRLFRPQGCENASLAYWTRSGASELKMEPGTLINFNVALERRSVRAMLDSGGVRSVVSLPVAGAVGRTPTSAGVEPAGCFTGLGKKRVESWVAPFDTVTIGDEIIHDAHLHIMDLWIAPRPGMGSRMFRPTEALPEMILGFDFLKTHRVLVSRSQRKMYFTYEGGVVFPPGPRGDCRDAPG